MRSLIFSWFSQSFMRIGIAALLAFLIVGGVALQTGALLHPQPAHASASFATQAERKLFICVSQGLTMTAITAASADVLVPVKAVQWVRNATLARIAVSQAAREVAATGAEVTFDALQAFWQEHGTLVKATGIGNCTGGIFISLYLPLADKLFPDDGPTSEADGAAFAADLGLNPSALCNRIIPGAQLDDSGLCYDQSSKNYYTAAGTLVGPTLCGQIAGTHYDQNSGYCADDANTYYGPDGTLAGTCTVGVPQGNGLGNCVDPTNGKGYDPQGNPLDAPPPNDPCADYVQGIGGSASDCSYATAPPSSTETPTPAPPVTGDPTGLWNYQLSYPDGSGPYASGTITINPQTPYSARCIITTSLIPSTCSIYNKNPNNWNANLFVDTRGYSSFVLDVSFGAGHDAFYFSYADLRGSTSTTISTSQNYYSGYILQLTR